MLLQHFRQIEKKIQNEIGEEMKRSVKQGKEPDHTAVFDDLVPT